MEGVKEMRQFARLQLAIVGLSVLVGLLLGAGGGGSDKVVRATRFEVVDAKGRVVGTFGTDKDGTVLTIGDRAAGRVVTLGSGAGGAAFVGVGDASGHPHVGMALAGKAAGLEISDGDGKPVWSAP